MKLTDPIRRKYRHKFTHQVKISPKKQLLINRTWPRTVDWEQGTRGSRRALRSARQSQVWTLLKPPAFESWNELQLLANQIIVPIEDGSANPRYPVSNLATAKESPKVAPRVPGSANTPSRYRAANLGVPGHPCWI